MATGESFNYLPAGPILGLPLAMQAQEQHSNADRRIRGKKNSNSLSFRVKILKIHIFLKSGKDM